MGKITINLIKCVLVLLLCSTVALFAFWLPSLHGYVRELLAELDESIYFLNFLVYPIAALIALPAVATVTVAFRFPSAIARDEIFSNSTAKNLKIISNMIFTACGAGISASLILFIIGDRILSPILFFAFLIGCTLGIMLAVLSNYVKRAAALKEEVDHTL
jgi:hypothetical protein